MLDNLTLKKKKKNPSLLFAKRGVVAFAFFLKLEFNAYSN
jgi:hypothetical protein